MGTRIWDLVRRLPGDFHPRRSRPARVRGRRARPCGSPGRRHWDHPAYTIHMGLEGWKAVRHPWDLLSQRGVENIGAHGQEVATTVESVQAWDQSTGEVVILTKDQ